ncbi:hypothetical protein GA0070624_2702 [Micromonospora rhizosphaerae]|uniref:Uncharacterized protein n=1 Tax=Micromonospora rhizosphaerae TaxID=568872 RepID=A0A1C6S1I1_9ACTN|nr:hypothetical protein [Micromonospora rhizosphaerae]SCL23256.1 hypothetical protein GA0070624_2702 [Micromonospora rhizosphaerae]
MSTMTRSTAISSSGSSTHQNRAAAAMAATKWAQRELLPALLELG